MVQEQKVDIQSDVENVSEVNQKNVELVLSNSEAESMLSIIFTPL
jgi:hypothetical protein